MRNPIRIKRSERARRRHYYLRAACASLLLLCFGIALGCSPENNSNLEESAARAASRERSSNQARDESRSSSPLEDAPVIVFLGTSLTAGYGLEESQAFPALIQEKIDQASLDYRVLNAGVSGDTSSGGLRRLSWLLRVPLAVLVLELGANDMLRGQSVTHLRSNLETILDQTREAHPDARLVIAGMRAAPNLGQDYAAAFDAVYPDLAKRYDAAFVPFLLEDVAAKRELNQADGIHPTVEGHQLIAERVWKSLEPVLRTP